jgi:hypothetical protein
LAGADHDRPVGGDLRPGQPRLARASVTRCVSGFSAVRTDARSVSP